MESSEFYEQEIAKVKKALYELGRIHPGSVSKQQQARGSGYYYLSYSFKNKGHTLYVREEHLDQVREEVENYREFRSLVNRWIELEIEYSQLRRGKKRVSS